MTNKTSPNPHNLFYMVRDSQYDSGRVLQLAIEKALSIEDATANFNRSFPPKENSSPIQVHSKESFLGWYSNFIPESVRLLMDYPGASGFSWQSEFFVSYG